MPFQVKNANYNALRKLSLRERMALATNKSMGQVVVQMLSPTQIAELFPKYWLQQNPNISGFLKAMPSSLGAARQREYEQQVLNTATGSAAGANYAAGGYRKKWQQGIDREQQRSQVSKRTGPPPPAQLSPEQREAFNALKAGDIGVNDPRMKWLKGISEKDLANSGISLVKDNTGVQRFHYSAPQVSDEDVKKGLVEPGAGANVRERIAWYRQYAKSIGVNPDWVAGIAIKEGAEGKDKGQPWGNRDRFRSGGSAGYSYGDFQLRVGIPHGVSGGMGDDFLKTHGVDESFMGDKKNWKMLGKFAIDNMKRRGFGQWSSVEDTMRREGISVGEAGNRWWSNYGTESARRDTLTQNYTPRQMEIQRRELQSQLEAGQISNLAQLTQPQGRVNAASNFGTDKWKSVSPIGGSGYCGRGVAGLALKIYGGRDGIFNGHLGTEKASDLTKGAGRSSNIFTQSGLYASGQSVDKESLTPEFLASLPPGTIVANDGGGLSKSGAWNAGHVQMKVGDKWMSDHAQKSFLKGVNRPNGEYTNFTIFYPTDKANKFLKENGYITEIPSSAPTAVPTMGPMEPPKDVEQRNDPYGTPDEKTKVEAEAMGITKEMQEGRKASVQGQVSFEGGGTYHFGSGRPDDPNFPSTPLGSSEVGGLNPHHVPGGVGYEMPSIQGWDPKVKRNRDGMVIHSAGHDDLKQLYSHGCISIPKSEFGAFEQEMEEFKKAHGGKAYINIMPDGRVTVTASPAYDKAGNYITPITPEKAIEEIQTNQPQVVQSAPQVVSGDVRPMPDTIQPLSSVTQPEGPINAAGPVNQQQQEQAPVSPAPAAPASASTPTAPEPPKVAAPTGTKFTFNKQNYLNEIARAHPMIDSPFASALGQDRNYAWNETVKGLREAEAAGVLTYDEKSGALNIKDMNHPRVQQILQDMKDNQLNQEAFLKKAEEKKKEQEKPATQVKAMAEGGDVAVNTEQIAAYPINGLRGDNAVVVNAHQKPLFTMNTNEDILMDPNNNRAQILPDSKNTGVGPMPKQDMTSGMIEEFRSTINDLRQDFASMKPKKIEQPTLARPTGTPGESNWISKINQEASDPYKSPTLRRVAYRAGGMETGDPSNNFHYSRGNNS